MAEEPGYAMGEESHPLDVKMNFHLPLPGQPKLTDVRAWKAPVLTEQGNRAMSLQIDEWKGKYGTNIYVVDKIMGQMYAEVGGEFHTIPEIASHRWQEEPALTPVTGMQKRPCLRPPTEGHEESTLLQGSEIDPHRASRPQGRVYPELGRPGAALEQRDRDFEVIGVIRPVASQPPP